MTKNLKFIGLALLMLAAILFITACTNSEKYVTFCTLGGNEIGAIKISDNNQISVIPENPLRDDNATFEGWYTNLSYDEKVDFTTKSFSGNTVLYAKWDKVYLFTLVYNRQGFSGQYKGGVLDFFIPAGSYNVTMMDSSTAKGGNVMVCDSNNYSATDGYSITQNVYFPRGATKEIIISSDNCVEITVNSVFMFERSDVNEKFLDTTYSEPAPINEDPNDFLLIFLISLLIFIGLVSAFMAYVLTKNKNNNTRSDSITFSNNDYSTSPGATATQKTECFLKYHKFNLSKAIKYEQAIFNSNKYSAIYIDNENRKWAIGTKKSVCSNIYNFSDLISFEVYQNGDSKVEGRVGSALIGGVFFGLAGAIAGSAGGKNIIKTCSSLRIRIRINDLNNPELVINLIKTEIGTNSSVYKSALELAKNICSNIEYMMNSEIMHNAKRNIAEEIRQYKSLFDEGIITQEEFETKKNQLLNNKHST